MTPVLLIWLFLDLLSCRQCLAGLSTPVHYWLISRIRPSNYLQRKQPAAQIYLQNTLLPIWPTWLAKLASE